MKNIGDYKYRIAIQQATKTRDSVGSYSASYSTVLSTWAAIKQMDGNKVLDFGQVSTNAMYEIYIRTRFDYEPNQNWQIIYNGKTLSIHSVIELDKWELKIIAFEAKRSETGNIATDWSQ